MIITASPSKKYEIIHDMISKKDNLLNITCLCETAGVSKAGYYKWLKADSTRQQRERDDESDFALILEAYKHRGYDKGAQGIYMLLLHMNLPNVINIKKIRRLMRKFNLNCPIRKINPYRQLAKALRTSKVAPNLLNRQFRAYGARMILLTDITYIPRNEGKYSYLSVIMDAYTKQILAHVCSYSLEIDFVLETVLQLKGKYGTELKTDVLIHSDQGCHYTSHKFINIINSSELRQSMSRKGNCWDNAPQECLFGHMKQEIHFNPSDSHSVISKKIDEWIEYYNNERYQWSLAKLSPNEYYEYIQTGCYPLQITKSNTSKNDSNFSSVGYPTDENN